MPRERLLNAFDSQKGPVPQVELVVDDALIGEILGCDAV